MCSIEKQIFVLNLSTQQLGQRKSGKPDISQNSCYVTRRGMACFYTIQWYSNQSFLNTVSAEEVMKCRSIKIIIVAQKSRIWKGMAVAYFKVPPKNMSGGTEKKCKSSDRTPDKPVKIQTLYPLNTSITMTASLIYHPDWTSNTV